jgi:hypothetical protein
MIVRYVYNEYATGVVYDEFWPDRLDRSLFPPNGRDCDDDQSFHLH